MTSYTRIAYKDHPIQNALYVFWDSAWIASEHVLVHVGMQAHVLIVPSMNTRGQKLVHFADVAWRNQSLFLVNCTFESVVVEKNKSHFCF